MARVDGFIRRGGVTVYIADLTAGAAPTALTGYTDVAHIQGNVTINDQRGTVTVKDFDTDEDAFDLQYTDGRTGSVAHNLNLVPGDTEHKLLIANYKANKVFALLIVAEDGTGNNSLVDAYEVQIQTFPRTYNESGVATGAITYLIHGEIAAPTGI